MDEKKVIEAAEAFIDGWVKQEDEGLVRVDDVKNSALFQALKEALEDKLSREDTIKHLEGDVLIDYTKDSWEYECISRAIELLKQPTMQWVEWEGTGQSIHSEVKYLVKWNNGAIEFGKGDYFDWSHDEGLPNIAEYMLIE